MVMKRDRWTKRGSGIRRWIAVLLLFITLGMRTVGVHAAAGGGDAMTVLFSVNEDYDIALYGGRTGLAVVEEDFKAIKELGVDHLRVSFSWSNYEPEPDQFRHLDWLHDFVDLAEAYGITLMPYLCYAPYWATTDRTWNGTPKDYDDWYDFVYRMVSEFKDKIHIWEIWNEEDISQWWSGGIREYGRLLEVGARAVRDADPDATILMGGLTKPDAFFVRLILDGYGLADAFDVLPIHNYSESWNPIRMEDYITSWGTRFDDVRDVLDRYGRGQPIWINEIGYPTIDWRTEEHQANFIRRAVSTLMATGHIELISWYEIKDLFPSFRAIGDKNNYHLGLMTVDRRKKTGFYTYQNLVSLLNREPVVYLGEQVTALLPEESRWESHIVLHGFQRERDGTIILFAWTRSPADGITADLRLPVGRIASAKEYDLLGQASEAAFSENLLTGIELRRDAPRLFEIVPAD